jgi:hypothetical protein
MVNAMCITLVCGAIVCLHHHKILTVMPKTLPASKAVSAAFLV